MSTPPGVPLTVSPRGGEAIVRPLAEHQASPGIPVEPARSAILVIDLVPVTGVRPPAMARVLPLEPVEAIRVERPSERARRVAGVLQALTAYLRAAEDGRPSRAPEG